MCYSLLTSTCSSSSVVLRLRFLNYYPNTKVIIHLFDSLMLSLSLVYCSTCFLSYPGNGACDKNRLATVCWLGKWPAKVVHLGQQKEPHHLVNFTRNHFQAWNVDPAVVCLIKNQCVCGGGLFTDLSVSDCSSWTKQEHERERLTFQTWTTVRDRARAAAEQNC